MTKAKKTKYSDTTEGWKLLQDDRVRANNDLPTITNHQRARLSRISGYAAYRMIDYLIANQGAATADIADAIAIKNLPDVAGKVRSQLEKLGLGVKCELTSYVNAHGRKVSSGTWWLMVTDRENWFQVPPSAVEFAG